MNKLIQITLSTYWVCYILDNDNLHICGAFQFTKYFTNIFLLQEAPCQRKCQAGDAVEGPGNEGGGTWVCSWKAQALQEKKAVKRSWARGQETPTWRLLLSLPCSVALKGIRILHPKICHFGMSYFELKAIENWQMHEEFFALPLSA